MSAELRRSQRKLEKAIRYTISNTKRSAKNSVLRAGLTLCDSGRANFKKRKGSTRRKVIRGGYTSSGKAKKGSPWIVVMLKQTGPPDYMILPYSGGKPS